MHPFLVSLGQTLDGVLTEDSIVLLRSFKAQVNNDSGNLSELWSTQSEPEWCLFIELLCVSYHLSMALFPSNWLSISALGTRIAKNEGQ